MKRKISILTFIVLAAAVCSAKVVLPSIFANGMMLQQNEEVKIWGKAAPAEKVTVNGSWGATAAATADKDGNWSTRLQTPEASFNEQYLYVSGAENDIRISDILIGEVWLCSGQSNMEFPVMRHAETGWQWGMLNEKEELQDADYPEIRLYLESQQLSQFEEKFDCPGRWMKCHPANLEKFSAIGFVFGRRLFKELGVPVAVVECAWGGTHAESWTKPSLMQNNPKYKDELEKFTDYHQLHKRPGTLWNGMVKPILGFTVKGNIWYQGESNWPRAEKYGYVFSTMLDNWRNDWEQPDMPFYYFLMAPNYLLPPELREQQMDVWQSGRKNLGMVALSDDGDSIDFHPRNKRLAGERIALWALNKQYGRDVACCGPVFKNMKIKGGKAVVTFNHAEKGLKTPNREKVVGFTVAGKDGVFYPAEAVIKGKKVEVSSPKVKEPAAVRFGWGKFYRANLYNSADLPAFPFRTDRKTK